MLNYCVNVYGWQLSISRAIGRQPPGSPGVYKKQPILHHWPFMTQKIKIQAVQPQQEFSPDKKSEFCSASMLPPQLYVGPTVAGMPD